jgi:hypothetical protein
MQQRRVPLSLSPKRNQLPAAVALCREIDTHMYEYVYSGFIDATRRSLSSCNSENKYFPQAE